METQGTKSNSNVFVPNEGRLIFSKDTLAGLEELGGVLKHIHRRMIAEGYEITDGQVRKKI